MDARQALDAQRAWINELLHRITTAETRDVRLHLCSEAKSAIGEFESMLTERASGMQQ